jgi:hypothetical protein
MAMECQAKDFNRAELNRVVDEAIQAQYRLQAAKLALLYAASNVAEREGLLLEAEVQNASTHSQAALRQVHEFLLMDVAPCRQS